MGFLSKINNKVESSVATKEIYSIVQPSKVEFVDIISQKKLEGKNPTNINKMDIEISSCMYNNTLPVDNEFDLDMD